MLETREYEARVLSGGRGDVQCEMNTYPNRVSAIMRG